MEVDDSLAAVCAEQVGVGRRRTGSGEDGGRGQYATVCAWWWPCCAAQCTSPAWRRPPPRLEHAPAPAASTQTASASGARRCAQTRMREPVTRADTASLSALRSDPSSRASTRRLAS